MFEDPSPPMTTPPLRRTRAAGRGRVLAIGDAAGYVEPFTGEGMTWAMRSGIAAAGVIAAGVGDLSRVGDEWNRQLSELLRGRKLACRTVTALLRWSLARRIAAAALSRWPALANPLIRGLSS
jgi:flavin-dependent dehydrogenase